MKFKTLCILTLAALSSLSNSAIAEINKSNDFGIDGFGRVKFKTGVLGDDVTAVPVYGVGFDLSIGAKNFPLYVGGAVNVYGSSDNIVRRYGDKYKTTFMRIDIDFKLSALVINIDGTKLYLDTSLGHFTSFHESIKQGLIVNQKSEPESEGLVLGFGITLNYHYFSVGLEAKSSKNKRRISKYTGIPDKQEIYLVNIGVQF